MKVNELQPGEFHEFYQTYLDNLPGDKSLGRLLQENQEEVREILSIISPEKLSFRYSKGKWSVVELFQHLLDVERIFQYRALCIARGDETSLPGFDHNAYVRVSHAERRDVDGFKKEFKNLRSSGIDLFNSFSEEMLKRIGLVNSAPTSVQAIGFIIVGHAKHHLSILKEKYLL